MRRATFARMNGWIGDAACVVAPVSVAKGCFLMVVPPALLGMVPEWALFGACWLAVGVFLVVSFACYVLLRVTMVPGVGGSRVSDVLVAVSVGGACALACALAVVAAAALGALI